MNVRGKLLGGGVYRLVYDAAETVRRYREMQRLHAQLEYPIGGRLW